MRTSCIAQGTLINALWSPRWEGVQGRGATCKHVTDSL